MENALTTADNRYFVEALKQGGYMPKSFAIVGFVVAATSGVALAGSKAPNPLYEVSVNTAQRQASGALGHARNSSDSNQYIGCSTLASSVGPTSGFCYASDAKNVYVGCAIPGAWSALIAQAQSIPSDGFISFTWDAGGNCTSIMSQTTSYLAPKQP